MVDVLETTSSLSSRMRQKAREVSLDSQSEADLAREISTAEKTLQDDLFINAPTQVARLHRVNQIRQQDGMRPLDKLPDVLEQPGFIDRMKQGLPRLKVAWSEATQLPAPGFRSGIATALSLALPDSINEKLEQSLQSGQDNTSYGLARAIYQGKAPTPPPDGIGWEVLAQSASLASDPVTAVSFGVGSLIGKKAVQEGVKHGLKGVVIPKIVESAVTSSVAFAGLTAPHTALHNVATKGEVDWENVFLNTVKAGVTGAVFGPAGKIPKVGILGEIGTLAGSDIIQGAPTDEAFLRATLFVGGFKAVGKAGQKSTEVAKKVARGLRKKLTKQTLTADEQAAVDQIPQEIQTKIAQKALNVPEPDQPMTKEHVMSGLGAAEFVRRHPETAQRIASIQEPLSRKLIAEAGVDAVEPNINTKVMNKTDRARFQANVQKAIGVMKPVDTLVPGFKRQEMIIGRLQNKYGEPVREVNGQFVLPDGAPVANQVLKQAIGEVDVKLAQQQATFEQGMQEVAQQGVVEPTATPTTLGRMTAPDATKLVRQARAAETRATADVPNTGQSGERMLPGSKPIVEPKAKELPPEAKGEAGAENAAKEETITVKFNDWLRDQGINPEKLHPKESATLRHQWKNAVLPSPEVALDMSNVVMPKTKGMGSATRLVRWMATGGVPSTVWDAMADHKARMRAASTRIEDSLRDYSAAKRAVYGRLKAIPEEVRDQINLVLGGEAVELTIPTEFRGPVRSFRLQVDNLSRALIDSGFAQGKLKAAIEANDGLYIHRGYALFTEPDFYKKAFKKLSLEDRDRTIALFRQELDAIFGDKLTPADAQTHIESFLYNLSRKGGEGGLFPQLEASGIAQKSLGMTRKRNEYLPLELQKLFGIKEDPASRFIDTAMQQAELLSSWEMQKSIRASGMDNWLFERPTGDAIHKIEGQARHLLGLTEGQDLYTHPAYAKALNTAFAPTNPNKLWRTYLWSNFAIKWGLTAGSVQGITRNLFFDPFFALANGQFKVWKAPEAMGTSIASLAPTVTEGFARRLNLPIKELREHVSELQRRDILEGGTTAGEYRDMLKDAIGHDSALSYGESIIKKAALATPRTFSKFWMLGQNFTRTYAYLNELTDLQSVYGESKSLEWMKDRAADKVRRGHNTYSRAPRIAREMRKAIVMGDFITYPIETTRTAMAIPRLIKEEYFFTEDGGQTFPERAIAMRRAVGYQAVAATMTSIGPASRQLSGISIDEDEALRVLGPFWMRNSLLVHLGKSGPMKYSVINASNTLPHAFLVNPIMAAMRGEELSDMETGPLAEMIRPFVNETVFTGIMHDLAMNEKISQGSNAKIWNPELPMEERVKTAVEYAYSKLRPGTLRTIDRVMRGVNKEPLRSGRIPDTDTEIMAAMFGIRRMDFETPLLIDRKIFNYKKRSDDARAIFNETAYRKDNPDISDVHEAYKLRVQAEEGIFKEIQGAAKAAQTLGMTEDQIVKQMVEKFSMSEGKAKQLVSGEFDPQSGLRDLVWQLGDSKMKNEKLPFLVHALGIRESELLDLLIEESIDRKVGYRSIYNRLPRARSRLGDYAKNFVPKQGP